MLVANLIKSLIQYKEHLTKLVASQAHPEWMKVINKEIQATTNLIAQQIREIQDLRDKEYKLRQLKNRAALARKKHSSSQSVPQNNQTSGAPSLDDFCDGVTPLMVACLLGLPNMVQQLILAGAKVDVATSSGKTALTWAVENGHDEVVELLLQYGANFRGCSPDYLFHPLVVATRVNSTQMIKLFDGLMTRFPNPHDHKAYSSAIFALIGRPIMSAEEEMLELFNCDKSVELTKEKTKQLLDLLEYFMPKCNKEYFLATRLIRSHACLEGKQHENGLPKGMYSALALAAEKSTPEVVKRLLEYGFEPNESMPLCVPPIIAATRNSETTIAKLLFEAGADKNVKFMGESVAHWAAGSLQALQMLKYLVAECNVLKAYDQLQQHRILDCAIRANNFYACEFLLSNGVSPNGYVDSRVGCILSADPVHSGHFQVLKPPVVAAIHANHVDVLTLILMKAAKKSIIDYRDKETGDNVLILAVKSKSLFIVRALLLHVGDEGLFEQTNFSGMNALQIAAKEQCTHIFYLLWSWLGGARGEDMLSPYKLTVIEERVYMNFSANLSMYLIANGVNQAEIVSLKEFILNDVSYPTDEFLLLLTELIATKTNSAVRAALEQFRYDALFQFYTSLLIECAKIQKIESMSVLEESLNRLESIFSQYQYLMTVSSGQDSSVATLQSDVASYIFLAHINLFFLVDKLHDHFMMLHDALQTRLTKIADDRLVQLCKHIIHLQKSVYEEFSQPHMVDALLAHIRESLLLRLDAYLKKFESLERLAAQYIRSEKNRQIKTGRRILNNGIFSQHTPVTLEDARPMLLMDEETLFGKRVLQAETSSSHESSSLLSNSVKDMTNGSRGIGSNANKRSRQQEAERLKQEQERQLELIQQAAANHQKIKAEQELAAKIALQQEESRRLHRERLRELSQQVNPVAKRILVTKAVRKKFNLLGSQAEQCYLVGSTAVKILQGELKDNNADWDFIATKFDDTHFSQNEFIAGLYTYRGKGVTQNIRDKIDVMLVDDKYFSSISPAILDLARESKRRDTTRKAVFIDVEGCVYDPTGYGLSDIQANTIRVIIDLNYATAEPAEIQTAIEARLLEDPKRLARWIKDMVEGNQPEDNLRAVLQRIDLQKIHHTKQQDELFIKIRELTNSLSAQDVKSGSHVLLDKYNAIITNFGLLDKLTWLRDQWKSRQANRSPQSLRLFESSGSQPAHDAGSSSSTLLMGLKKV